PLHFLINHRVATNKTPALEYYFVLSLSTLCTVSFVRNHCLAHPIHYSCAIRSQPHIQTHSQEHGVEIRTVLTSHTLYQQTNTTMDTFLIRKSQKEKPVDFFKHKRDGLQQQQTTISKHSTVSKQCLGGILCSCS